MERPIKIKRAQRVRRNRARISGTRNRPRLAVFRSNKYLTLQLIDDTSGNTIVAASTTELKRNKKTKVEQAAEIGELLAKRAKNAKIDSAVLDRRYYKYHGRVRAAADGVRSGGLKI